MATNDVKTAHELGEASSIPPGVDHIEHTSNGEEIGTPIVRVDSYLDEQHVKLTWRSWMVILYLLVFFILNVGHVVLVLTYRTSVTCFAVMAQVFVVVAAGSVIAFIARDFPGDASLSGWVIQGPLLMQSVLSPIIGRLSDVVDRKYLATIPPIIAFVGAIISAKATSMTVLIIGGVLIGVTLSTISIVQAIPSEVLPLKWRALANGFAGFGGSVGGVIGGLGAGGVTNANAGGWRDIFWMQAAFHAATVIGLLLFYHPKRASDFPKMSLSKIVWACDPIGSLLFICSTTLMLLALDWVGGSFPWHNTHVAVPLSIGLFIMVVFFLYEWKGRTDGIVAHVFFAGNNNFALSIFAFAVEGWIFYSAVNSITPQIVLNLGFESSSWRISIRQLVYSGTVLLTCIPISMYSTKYKDLKSPVFIGFGLFLIVTICYATITPSENKAQIGFNVITGFGQSGPLTLLVALVQFTSPHAYLSTATGLAFSARAIGGAFGSAILDAIINGKLGSTYSSGITKVAIKAGLPASSVAGLILGLKAGTPIDVPGINGTILTAVTDKSHNLYAEAYRLAWASIIPFVVIAMVAIACLKGVEELMTEHVEATVEVSEQSRSSGSEEKVAV